MSWFPAFDCHYSRLLVVNMKSIFVPLKVKEAIMRLRNKRVGTSSRRKRALVCVWNYCLALEGISVQWVWGIWLNLSREGTSKTLHNHSPALISSHIINESKWASTCGSHIIHAQTTNPMLYRWRGCFLDLWCPDVCGLHLNCVCVCVWCYIANKMLKVQTPA